MFDLDLLFLMFFFASKVHVGIEGMRNDVIEMEKDECPCKVKSLPTHRNEMK